MFEVTVRQTFSAAHFLRDYKGKCENLHGHNYRVEVTARGEHLGPGGMLVDFVDLKRAARTVIDQLDHTNLNETPPFDPLNPSAENIAWHICTQIQNQLGEAGQIAEVRVWETDTCVAAFRP